MPKSSLESGRKGCSAQSDTAQFLCKTKRRPIWLNYGGSWRGGTRLDRETRVTLSGPEKRAGLDPEGGGKPIKVFSNDVRKPDLVFLKMGLSVCPDDGLGEGDTRHQERLYQKNWMVYSAQTCVIEKTSWPIDVFHIRQTLLSGRNKKLFIFPKVQQGLL